MVQIRQHGSKGELFDIQRFLADVDQFIKPDSWDIAIDWCQGPDAIEIQSKTEGGLRLGDADFRALYKGIFRTIDGRFQLFSDGALVAPLEAIDSSYWEIEGPQNLKCTCKKNIVSTKPIHNVSVNWTACKRCLQVPSARCASAASYLNR
jgi:hypothetical protein